MASKLKVTVSLDERLLRALSQASRKRRMPRSRLVEEALRLWQRSQLEQALKRGYLAMAAEDRATAERGLRVAREVLR